MRNLWRSLLLAVLLLGSVQSLSAQAYTGSVAANAFITFGGLDWAWASPCEAVGGCSSIVISGGWRFATLAEWAQRPDASIFLDDGGNTDGMRCASGWFDVWYTHCDYSDAVLGYVTSGPGVGSSQAGLSETWLVRDQAHTVTPEPVSMMLVGTGLAGLVTARRRRKSIDVA